MQMSIFGAVRCGWGSTASFPHPAARMPALPGSSITNTSITISLHNIRLPSYAPIGIPSSLQEDDRLLPATDFPPSV
eukprot:2753789-Rhodomonas_salina.1